jgi:hypothetical protein
MRLWAGVPALPIKSDIVQPSIVEIQGTHVCNRVYCIVRKSFHPSCVCTLFYVPVLALPRALNSSKSALASSLNYRTETPPK